MEELTWGTPLFFDLWMAGMAGGAFFAALLIREFGADREGRLLKLATYIGLPLVLLGVLALLIDLGNPIRAWHLYLGLRASSWQIMPDQGVATTRSFPPSLYLHPASAMSMGSWILVLWSLNAVVLIVLWILERRGQQLWITTLVKILGWVGFVLSALLMTYTGVVLGVSSKALWQATWLLPSLFVASASGTGVAALLLTAPWVGIKRDSALRAPLQGALAVLIGIQIVVLVALLIWLGVAGVAAPLISGGVGILFWIGVVLGGLVLPLILLSSTLRERVSAVAPLLVLLGGFLLRAAVVVSGQI